MSTEGKALTESCEHAESRASLLGMNSATLGKLGLAIFACLAVEFWEPVYRPTVAKKT